LTTPAHEAADRFAQAMRHCPLVAILRGVRPDEIEAMADALVEAGFSMIEVPLNSPEPLVSIGKIAHRYGDTVLVGAGTVLSVADVEAVHGVGGRLMVSPNVNPAVIARSVELGMVALLAMPRPPKPLPRWTLAPTASSCSRPKRPAPRSSRRNWR
jgi:2-dehydro-3-deoxyphosphogalactonate aldolase